MSFILSTLNAIKKVTKLRKKAKQLKSKDIFKILRDSVLITFICLSIIISLIGGSIYAVTYAVASVFEKAQQFLGTNNPTAEQISTIDKSKIDEFADDSGALLSGDKLLEYIAKEKNSCNISKTGIKTVIKNDGYGENVTNSTENLDLQKYKEKYLVNWQFISSVDLATFRANDSEDKTVLNSVNDIEPEFSWYDDVTRDVTDYSKEWMVVNVKDSHAGTDINVLDTESIAPEKYVTTKSPLAIPSSVKTMFGTYNYTINRDQVMQDDPYCSPYITTQDVKQEQKWIGTEDDLTKPIYEHIKVIKYKDNDDNEYTFHKGNITDEEANGTFKYLCSQGDYYIFINTSGKFFRLFIPKGDIDEDSDLLDGREISFVRTTIEDIFKGYEQKDVYTTITTTTTHYKKTRRKVIEDTTSEPNLNFEPTKFIRFLNNCDLKVKDLYLVRESLLNLPKGNSLVDGIDRIISGDYGDLSTGAIGGIGNANADISGVIPLFLQADERWGNIPYYTKPDGTVRTIAAAGCGITSLAMVVDGLGGDINAVKEYDKNNDGILTPDETCQYSKDNGFYDTSAGTSKAIYSALGSKMGLKVTQTSNPNEAYNALKEGKVAIASMTPGHFTRGGHLIVLTGVPTEGQVSVNDPASKERSINWDFNIVKSEADDYFIFENPNYVTETFTITSYFGATKADIPALGADVVGLEGEGALITSTGLSLVGKSIKDRLCAVDPTVIPYHSKAFINFGYPFSVRLPDGTDFNVAGYYTAEDTGGAFRGGARKIDIYSGAYGDSPLYQSISNEIGSRPATVRYRKK